MDYDGYSEQCKGNYFSLKDKETVNAAAEKEWAAIGNSGPFLWFALGLFYDKSIHTIDAFKKQHNVNNKLFYEDPHRILSVINHSSQFKNLVRNPYVVNTEASYTGTTNGLYEITQAVNVMLKGFFAQEGDEVFYNIQSDGTMSVNISAIEGKDLIICYPFAEGSSLPGFQRIATSLMSTDAPHSVVGLFPTRVVPDVNGRYPMIDKRMIFDV